MLKSKKEGAKSIMRRLAVLIVAFALLMSGSFASGGMEAQAAAASAKVSIKSAKANDTHPKITVSWKSVKNATGYQIIYRKTDSQILKKVTVRKASSKVLPVSTTKASCKIQVRAFRQVKVKGKTKTYYGRWSDIKIVKKKNTTPASRPGNGGSQNSGSSDASGYVWIPSSGKKYHKTSTCSNMKNPSKVTKSYAESLGYTPCKRCY